jgi:hypothetical protein
LVVASALNPVRRGLVAAATGEEAFLVNSSFLRREVHEKMSPNRGSILYTTK